MNPVTVLAAVMPLIQKFAPEIGLGALAVYHAVAKHDKAAALADLIEAAQELGVLPANFTLPAAEAPPAEAPAA